MPRFWTHEGNAVIESGHKAPPTAAFLPVTGKTRFAAEAGWLPPSPRLWRTGRRCAPRNDKEAISVLQSVECLSEKEKVPG